jgi:hypothetical protein
MSIRDFLMIEFDLHSLFLMNYVLFELTTNSAKIVFGLRNLTKQVQRSEGNELVTHVSGGLLSALQPPGNQLIVCKIK